MRLNLPAGKVLCILYGSGGTSDVARHAVQAALDRFDGPIRVLSADPRTTLAETNWNCACPHNVDLEDPRLDLRAINVAEEDLTPHLENVGAVISGLGNRQPWFGNNIAAAGTNNLVKAMDHHKISRLVMVTSAGCNEDFPPVEFHWVGSILKWIFRLLARGAYKDLCLAEDAVRQKVSTGSSSSTDSTRDYLIVRPTGLGEDRYPADEWVIQKEKFKDKVGFDMAKMDCARFCLQEAIEPTYHRDAVVIGSDFDKCHVDAKQDPAAIAATTAAEVANGKE